MMKKYLAILCMALFIIPQLASATCYLVTDHGFYYDPQCDRVPDSAERCFNGHGLIPDYDCDRINDFFDNCPLTYNPFQLDYNHDGEGDACAGFIPGEKQDELFGEYTELVDDMKDILGLEDKSILGENFDTSKLDPNSPNFDPALLEQLQGAGALSEDDKNALDAFSDQLRQLFIGAKIKVMIDILDEQDARPGESVVFPIRIINEGDEEHSIKITMNNMNAFGTYSIEPEQAVSVGPGEVEFAYVHVRVDEYAELGTRHLTLYIDADGEKTSAPLRLNIYDFVESKAPNAQDWFSILLAIVVILLVLVTVIIAFRRSRSRRGSEDIDEFMESELESYY